MMRQQQLSAAGKVVEIGATQRFLRIAPGAIPGRGGGQDAIRILPGSLFHWLPAGPNFSALSQIGTVQEAVCCWDPGSASCFFFGHSQQKHRGTETDRIRMPTVVNYSQVLGRDMSE